MLKTYARRTLTTYILVLMGTAHSVYATVPEAIVDRASAIAQAVGGAGTVISAVSRVDDLAGLKQATKVIYRDSGGNLQNLIMLPDGEHFIAGPLAQYDPTTGDILRGNGEIVKVDSGEIGKISTEPFKLDGIFRSSNFTNSGLALFSDPITAPSSYMSLLSGAPAISEGSGEAELLVFFDPGCPLCMRKYEDLRPLIASNQVTVHWIPVVGPSVSPYSKLLALIDPSADNDERLKRLEAMTNGKIPDGKVGDIQGAKELLSRTTAMLSMIRGISSPTAQAGTPQTFYKTPDGVLHLQFGYSQDNVQVIKRDFQLK